MPIYEYVCQACGHDMEALQKISDPPLTECPRCGKPELKKQISAAGFRLKGGGWYETDFKKGADKKKNLAGDAASSGDATKKAETKSDAKSDAKSESKPAKSSSE